MNAQEYIWLFLLGKEWVDRKAKQSARHICKYNSSGQSRWKDSADAISKPPFQKNLFIHRFHPVTEKELTLYISGKKLKGQCWQRTALKLWSNTHASIPEERYMCGISFKQKAAGFQYWNPMTSFTPVSQRLQNKHKKNAGKLLFDEIITALLCHQEHLSFGEMHHRHQHWCRYHLPHLCLHPGLWNTKLKEWSVVYIGSRHSQILRINSW